MRIEALLVMPSFRCPALIGHPLAMLSMLCLTLIGHPLAMLSMLCLTLIGHPSGPDANLKEIILQIRKK